MTARPKFFYVRSRKLLAAIKTLACQCCGAAAPSDPAHSNQGCHGKGKGIKASDVFVAALCRACHRLIDQGSTLGEAERLAIWMEAWRATVRALLRLGRWPPEIDIPDIRILTPDQHHEPATPHCLPRMRRPSRTAAHRHVRLVRHEPCGP